MHFRIWRTVFFILGVTLNMLVQSLHIQAQQIQLERVHVFQNSVESAAEGLGFLPLEIRWKILDTTLSGDHLVRINRYIDDQVFYQPVDSVRIAASPNHNWGDPEARPDLRQERYRIELIDPNGNALPSPNNFNHGAIFLHELGSIDICERTIELSWDNYIVTTSEGIEEEVAPFFTHNRIFVLPPRPGSVLVLDSMVDFSINTYTFLLDDGPGEYRFLIQAVQQDASGDIVLFANSNTRILPYESPLIDHLQVEMVDVVNNQYVEVVLSVQGRQPGDALAFDYQLFRASSATAPFDFAGVPIFNPGDSTYLFTDTGLDLSQGPFFYYASAILNGCSESVMESEIVSSLFLTADILTYTEDDLQVRLLATQYPGLSNIDVYRILPRDTVWSYVGSFGVSTSEYIDDLSNLIADLSGEIRYKLEAADGINTIESNWALVTVNIGLEIYNAMYPGSSSQANRYFRPRLKGLNPTFYRLSIFNRWGQEIFAIENPVSTWEGWDGIDMNGRETPPGVYGYRFEYRVEPNTRQEHTGTVTLVR